MAEEKLTGYTNIRVLRSSHAKLKEIIDRFDTTYVRFIDAISELSEEDIDKHIKPFVEAYEKKRYEEMKNGTGISSYMLEKRIKTLRDKNPEELQKFIDSL